MQLDVESLRTLIVVFDQGSITKAASVLNVSRSAASWRVKRLEEHVGQELIIRDGRDLRLSPAGRAVLDDARILVETHDRIALKLVNADLTGKVTVGADTDADVGDLTRVLGSFRRVHPGVELNLTVDRGMRILDGLASGSIDVCVIQTIDERRLPGDRVLWSDELVWATGRWAAFDDGDVPLVTFGLDCYYRALAERVLDSVGIPYRIALSVPSTDTAVASTEDGLGVALVPRSKMTDRLVEWGPAADLPPLPEVRSVVRAAPKVHSDTVDLLVESLAAELGWSPDDEFEAAS